MSPLDLSLTNLWRSWYRFRQGKKASKEIDQFQYYLERNLRKLHQDLVYGNYRPGVYRRFQVTDSKKRQITVAGIRDRVVHRLIYDCLVSIFDRTFIYDAWSCRKGKGLTGAINRSQRFLSKYPIDWVWRSDIKKFFDSVDQQILLSLIKKKIIDESSVKLISSVIDSYQSRERERESSRVGLPIGNLTSQIFANIYLNELDYFVKNRIKPKAYLRYGDDFFIVEDDLDQLNQSRRSVTQFLNTRLNLVVNQKNDIMVKVRLGVKFLGVEIYPKGYHLTSRNRRRIEKLLNYKNIPSYHGLIKNHENIKRRKIFNYQVLDLSKEQF